MSLRISFGTIKVLFAAILAGVVLRAVVVASLARGTIMVDRHVARRERARTLIPEYAEPGAAGDTIADREIGQPDFLHNSTNFVDGQSLNTENVGMIGLAVDQSSIPNRLYVVDSLNSRVLGWASVAALVNGKAADIVIGQPDFFSAGCNDPFGAPSSSNLCFPAGIAVDSSGNLYVADQNNNRVLEYNTPFNRSGSHGSGDAIADEVFGQGDNFTSNTCNLTALTSANATTLCIPAGVAIDSMGNLYIADSGNSRVLEYSYPSINTTANLVFGQQSFTGTVCNDGGVSRATMCLPSGVALDSANHLYVADTGNSRALEYNTPLTASAVPNRLFGQTAFNLNLCNQGGAPAANRLCSPTGVALDGSDNLYIADQGNRRVLEYNTPLTNDTTADKVFGQNGNFKIGICNFLGLNANALCRPSGVALDTAGDLFVLDNLNNRTLKYTTPLATDTTADVVLGQPDFAHGSPNEVDANSVSHPSGVALDTRLIPPRLYVADTLNNRVLGFNNATSFANGAQADFVIGQPDFFSGACNRGKPVSASSLCGPMGIAVDRHGNLYVADGQNSRVLEYDVPVTSGKAAHLVFGQPNLISSGCNDNINLTPTAATLCLPQAVAIDGSDNVYIVDTNNDRVLEYTTPLISGTTAEHVFGQPGFNTADCDHNGSISPVTLCVPTGVAVDRSGNVYIADTSNNRVLEYNTPLTAGFSADRVFGQGDNLNTNLCNFDGTTSKGLCLPNGLAVDRAATSISATRAIIESWSTTRRFLAEPPQQLYSAKAGFSPPAAPTLARGTLMPKL